MVAEEVAMVNFSPITSEQGGQVLDYQKQPRAHKEIRSALFDQLEQPNVAGCTISHQVEELLLA